jgi:hypothetical protein
MRAIRGHGDSSPPGMTNLLVCATAVAYSPAVAAKVMAQGQHRIASRTQ